MANEGGVPSPLPRMDHNSFVLNVFTKKWPSGTWRPLKDHKLYSHPPENTGYLCSFCQFITLLPSIKSTPLLITINTTITAHITVKVIKFQLVLCIIYTSTVDCKNRDENRKYYNPPEIFNYLSVFCQLTTLLTFVKPTHLINS